MFESAASPHQPRFAGAPIVPATHDRFEATFHHAPVGIAHVAPDGRFIDVNAQFAEITGHSRAALLAHGFQRITHPDDLQSDLAQVTRLLSGVAARYRMEKRYIRADGRIVWVTLTVALIRDEAGEPAYFISVIEDITEMRRARHEATRDPLTGLLNRRGFDERLERTRAQAKASGTPFTLVYLDLDSFKRINDELGHARGDACLVDVARALTKGAAPGDRIARIGGDEFLLLLPATDAADVPGFLDQLRAVLSAIEVAPGWTVRGSLGAITVDGGDPRPSQMLIQLADAEMFIDKRDGSQLS
jgi:diguanylate cyclase (GGDEF)-like protein/PAS domain S-box-containing protein